MKPAEVTPAMLKLEEELIAAVKRYVDTTAPQTRATVAGLSQVWLDRTILTYDHPLDRLKVIGALARAWGLS